MVRSDRSLIDSPFRWASVVMNLPGTTKYNPRMPWVYKWDVVYKRIATDFLTFMDDTRVFEGDKNSCMRKIYRIAILMNYLGEQNAARKREHLPKLLGCGLV